MLDLDPNFAVLLDSKSSSTTGGATGGTSGSGGGMYFISFFPSQSVFFFPPVLFIYFCCCCFIHCVGGVNKNLVIALPVTIGAVLLGAIFICFVGPRYFLAHFSLFYHFLIF
jgi:hypothetical protein